MNDTLKMYGSIGSEITNKYFVVAICFKHQPRWRRLQTKNREGKSMGVSACRTTHGDDNYLSQSMIHGKRISPACNANTLLYSAYLTGKRQQEDDINHK